MFNSLFFSSGLHALRCTLAFHETRTLVEKAERLLADSTDERGESTANKHSVHTRIRIFKRDLPPPTSIPEAVHLLQLYLGSILHEMVHSFFNIYVCKCEVRCARKSTEMEEDGCTGHGLPFLRVARGIEKFIKGNLGMDITLGVETALAVELVATKKEIWTVDLMDLDMEEEDLRFQVEHFKKKQVEGVLEKILDRVLWRGERKKGGRVGRIKEGVKERRMKKARKVRSKRAIDRSEFIFQRPKKKKRETRRMLRRRVTKRIKVIRQNKRKQRVRAGKIVDFLLKRRERLREERATRWLYGPFGDLVSRAPRPVYSSTLPQNTEEDDPEEVAKVREKRRDERRGKDIHDLAEEEKAMRALIKAFEKLTPVAGRGVQEEEVPPVEFWGRRGRTEIPRPEDGELGWCRQREFSEIKFLSRRRTSWRLRGLRGGYWSERMRSA